MENTTKELYKIRFNFFDRNTKKNIYFCLNFLIFFKKNFEMNFFHSKNINLFLKSKFQQLS